MRVKVKASIKLKLYYIKLKHIDEVELRAWKEEMWDLLPWGKTMNIIDCLLNQTPPPMKV